MVMLTIRRIRYLGLIAGIGCILLGLTVLLFPPAGWSEQHLSTLSSFVVLPVIGFAVIFFTHIRDIALITKAASYAGYTPSEEEKGRVEERLREMGKRYLLVPAPYTLVWLIIVYFIVEPSGLLADEKVFGIYIVLTWSVPMLLIIFIILPYTTFGRRPDTRILLTKAVEGAKVRKRMRELGETSPKDLRILNEGESSELETQTKEKPRKSKAKRK